VSDDRPNVLLIVVHDLGTRLGCYGYDNVPSANLDRLAAEGVRFTRNFCTAPYCSPSRGSIVSGQYPHVNGLMGLVNLGWDWREEAPTLAKCLGAAGCDTHLFGFQHEARNEHIDRLGFGSVSDRSLSHNCRVVAPLVEEFLAARGEGDGRPFYARVGFNEVHRSFRDYAPEDPAKVSLPAWVEDTPGAREDFAEYDGAIREMDAAVGRILGALEAAGLGENTVVVFTTDHGSPFPRAKATLYEAGVNTALLMRWPAGEISGGRVFDEMLSNVDLFPTLLEICGAEDPGGIQGRSFLPLLRGGGYEPREWVFAEKNTSRTDAKRCVRTDKYKYIRNCNPGPQLMLSGDAENSLTRRDMGNDHVAPRPEVELYDLEEDPLERENLAGRAEFEDVEGDMAARLRELQEETGDPILAGPIPRPDTEAGIAGRYWQNARAKCRFPREGLLAGYDVIADPDRKWEFAEPRARF
jgi:arylsulfatase A-like enzyme